MRFDQRPSLRAVDRRLSDKAPASLCSCLGQRLATLPQCLQVIAGLIEFGVLRRELLTIRQRLVDRAAIFIERAMDQVEPVFDLGQFAGVDIQPA